MKKSNRSPQGFTLVEIMIVVAIIALLASIALPSFMRARKRSQATKMLQELRLIDQAVDQYAIEYNLKPSSTAIAKGSQLAAYVKTSTGLADRLNKSTDTTVESAVEGIDYTIPAVDKQVAINLHGVDYSDVLQAGFWSPFSVN